MFDFQKATKNKLADVVRSLQEERGVTISASSTLLRLKPDALIEKIGVLCGDDLTIGDDGAVVAADVVETQTLGDLDAAIDEDLEADEAASAELDTDAETAEELGTTEPSPPANGHDEPAAKKGRTATQPDGGVITVVAADAKYRAGSKRAEYFGKFRSGQTVADYVASAGPKARRAIRKAVAAGHITISQPLSRG